MPRTSLLCSTCSLDEQARIFLKDAKPMMDERGAVLNGGGRDASVATEEDSTNPRNELFALSPEYFWRIAQSIYAFLHLEAIYRDGTEKRIATIT
jgi:hypothetical protein